MSTTTPGKNQSQTYYQILGLKENCSNVDIRNAFVTLSKTCHPDMNTSDKGLHDKFVSLNEAYTVLSKPSSRRSYDSLLNNSRINSSYQGQGQGAAYSSNYNPNIRYRPPNSSNRHAEDEPFMYWRDETIWHMRDKTRFYGRHHDAYYGFRGVKRKPNSWIAAGAFVLMGIGVVFHYIAFRYSTTFRIEQLNLRDAELNSHLRKTRENAKNNGTEFQLHKLMDKSEDIKKTKLD